MSAKQRQIRPATIDDAEGIAAVGIASWRWAYQGVVPEELIAQWTKFDERVSRIRTQWNPEFLYLVSVVDGQVVGMAREGKPVPIPDFDASIGSLYVAPDHSRGGHGSALFRAMVKEFLARGSRSMCIETLRDNLIGRGFYDKHGGTVVAEDTWQTLPAVWYGWKDLNALA